jgi:hypothetical protein
MLAAILLPLVIAAVPFCPIFNLNKKQKIGCAMMPSIWLFIGLWGAVFRYKSTERPELILNLVWVYIALYVLYGLYFVIKSKGRRIFVISYFFANLYFVLSIGACSLMSISDDWL